jgi:hypothetical protein
VEGVRRSKNDLVLILGLIVVIEKNEEGNVE